MIAHKKSPLLEPGGFFRLWDMDKLRRLVYERAICIGDPRYVAKEVTSLCRDADGQLHRSE